MSYLLDTNACIVYLNGSSQSIKNNLEKRRPNMIKLCAIVKVELYTGAMKSQHPSKVLAKLAGFFSVFANLPFDDNVARYYADIRSELERQGLPIGSYDYQIAATASLLQLNARNKQYSRISACFWLALGRLAINLKF